jgi:ribokinase
LEQFASQFGTLVETRGEKGVLVIRNGEQTVIPAYKVKAVDTTAAGDAFNGALAVSLGSGMDLQKAVQYANAVGAMAVTRLGAMPSLPYKAEVDEFLLGYAQEELAKDL